MVTGVTGGGGGGTPSVTVVRNSYVLAQNGLHIPTVSNSEAEILNIFQISIGRAK